MSPGSKGDVDDARKFNENPEPDEDEHNLDLLFEYIDGKHGFFINRLRDFVEFRTISSDPSMKCEFPRMAEFMVGILKKFGIHSTVMNMIEAEETGERAEGEVVPLILAETEIDPSKRTVLFYCHYDVHPKNYQECWADPFELTMTNDESELHGKGTSAGKGPLLCVINAIGAYERKKIPLPVNVKIILDPMGTADEDFTGKFLRRIDTDFFFNVDFVCLCTGRWLGTTRPCICHGSRGICHFTVEVEGPSKDLHSGSYGGLFNEPMADLIYILNGLVDRNGIIRVTDIYEDVPPVTKEGKDFFKSIHFCVRDLQQELGAAELQVNEDKVAILMRLWCQPSLTIHGIQGAFSDPGTKNVIPRKVTGKFSINLVPNMSPSKVKNKVVDYLAKVWKTRKSANKIRVQMTVGKLFWHTDPADMNVVAAKNAVAKVYNTEPDLIRAPNRIRIANFLRKTTEAPVVMIPIGRANDISDSDAEKVDVTNYINGSKIFTAYMMYLAKLFPRVKTPEDGKCTCKITGQIESCKCYLQYIPPPTPPLPEEETSNKSSSDWSVSKMLPPGMSTDTKPEFKYYYLSLQAMKRMQKLQEIISISHLAPIGLNASSRIRQEGEDQAIEQEMRTSIQVKESRAALGSFSVSDLHDESKPRTGGWLAKRTSTAKHQLETPSSEVHVDSGSMRPPESRTRIIPQGAQPFELPLSALEPTVFSFRLAQNLKKGRSEPFSPAKYQVLRKIRSVIPPAKVPGKDAASYKSVDGIPAAIISSNSVGGNEKQKLDSDSKSAPDWVVNSQIIKNLTVIDPSAITITSDSQVNHPKVTHSVKTTEVVSTTSRILYDKRLQREVTESTTSLKSINASFRVLSSRNIIGSPDMEHSTSTDAHLPRSETAALMGDPNNSDEVVSSLSKVLYDKRMTKKMSDSMKGLVSSSIKKKGSPRSASPTANSPASSAVSSAASLAAIPATKPVGRTVSVQPEQESHNQVARTLILYDSEINN